MTSNNEIRDNLLQGKFLKIMIKQSLLEHCLPSSESAVNLLCMIAAHESGGFMYNKQVNGPALSIFQIESRTYLDVCDYAKRRRYLSGEIPNPEQRLIFDLPFASAIARIFFLRIPEPLPGKDDISGLADYAKKYWNTERGKATANDYARAYTKYFD